MKPIRQPDINIPKGERYCSAKIWIEENIIELDGSGIYRGHVGHKGVQFTSMEMLIEYELGQMTGDNWNIAINDYVVDNILLSEE